MSGDQHGTAAFEAEVTLSMPVCDASTQVFAPRPAASVEPFLKWAGGKRWAVKTIAELAPKTYDRYIEPFLGGGSVFFALSPKIALLSDVNSSLIATYRHVREHSAAIERCLSWLQMRHSKTLYYSVREREPSDPVLKAARFIYLNRTCWNGLYRVNRVGQFNVPIGTKTKVAYDNGLHLQAAALRAATLLCGDFADTLAHAGSGDFVFIDPPYTVRHNNNGFLKYNEEIFSWADQERLAAAVRVAIDRGAHILVSNADHPCIRDLYSTLGEIIPLQRSSVIAGSPAARGKERELMVRCY